MKVAIYSRVSTKDQRTETQTENLKEYCKRMTYEIYGIYEDKGQSGLKDSRPEFNRLMNDVRLRLFDAVVVWKLDRIGRSLQHLLHILQEFKNKNIDFVSVTQNIDTTTASGKLMFQIMGAFAEFESSLISERVRAGKEKSKIKQGRKNKGVNLKKVLELKKEGLSLRQIAGQTKVSYGTIYNLLKGNGA